MVGMFVVYKLGLNVLEVSVVYGCYNINKVVMRVFNMILECGKVVVICNVCLMWCMYFYFEIFNLNVWVLVIVQLNLFWYWYFYVWNVMVIGEFNEVIVWVVVLINYYCEFVGCDDIIVEDIEIYGIIEFLVIFLQLYYFNVIVFCFVVIMVKGKLDYLEVFF